MPIDEMVDGKGGLRPHWRRLMSAIVELGHAEVAARAARLDRAIAEDGITGLIPGAGAETRPFDPIPMLLGPEEFAALAEGLAQRARLLDRVLADLYGPQRLVAEGAVPPVLLAANPAFLRPCHLRDEAPAEPMLHFYAADLVRGPDGAWCVLADHTGLPDGVARAIENRQTLGQALPEFFAAHQVAPLDPFMEAWLAMLRATAAATTAAATGAPAFTPSGRDSLVALLTAGHANPAWYGHLLLARELSCALVEAGDLTVREGTLFLKTLRGLQPIGVLLRGVPGGGLDPLELARDRGVAGLLAVPRERLRILNHPGAALAETPALAAFLPALAPRLLGETLALPGIDTRWLGAPGAAEAVLAAPESWWLVPAFAQGATPVDPAGLPAPDRAALLDAVRATPWAYAARARVAPSMAPCLATAALVPHPSLEPRPALEPRPVLLRLFLVRTSEGWQAMRGGQGFGLADDAPLWPDAARGIAKDLWVPEGADSTQSGIPPGRVPMLPIRRGSGELPSRVADDFFWFGRYLERLEAAAFLLRLAAGRAARPAPTPHELAELEVLIACLTQTGLLEAEAVMGLGPARLAQALPGAAARQGAIHGLLRQVSSLAGRLRDRLTGQTYGMALRGVREVAQALARVDSRADGQALDQTVRASTVILGFAAAMSGLAAENMVRGGGRMFLDLGRRVERAAAIAELLAAVLAFPGAQRQPVRVEHGLRLALELCDSAITYRGRYLAVVQPAPVLDLLLADEGNPRGFAFQLVAAEALLGEIAAGAPGLAGIARDLADQARRMVAAIGAASDQAVAAAALPEPLAALGEAVGGLSDDISRRYFALVRSTRTDAMSEAGAPA